MARAKVEGLRSIASSLQPQAQPTSSYAIPEQIDNTDIRFKADMLENAFAKVQKLNSSIMSDKLQKLHDENLAIAAFKADNEFALFRKDLDPMIKNMSPEQVEWTVTQKFQEKFEGVFADDGDPRVQDALNTNLRNYVPRAITESINAQRERQTTKLADEFGTSIYNIASQYALDSDPQVLFDQIDEKFQLAKKSGLVDPETLNETILRVGADFDHDFILQYAKYRKLDRTQNPAYERGINALISKSDSSEFIKKQNADKRTMYDLADSGLYLQARKKGQEIRDAYQKIGKTADWTFEAERRAQTTKDKTIVKEAKKRELEQVTQAAIDSGVIPVDATYSDGKVISQNDIKRGIYARLKTPEGMKENGAKIIPYFPIPDIQRQAEAALKAVGQITSEEPLFIDGQEVDGQTFARHHLEQFKATAQLVYDIGGEDALAMQLGDEGYEKWNVIKSLETIGTPVETIASYMANPKFVVKVTNDQVEDVMSGFNTDDGGWWDILNNNEGGNVTAAKVVVGNYIKTIMTNNDGRWDGEIQAAAINRLKEVFEVVPFGDTYSLINTYDPVLRRALADPYGKKKDQPVPIMTEEQMVEVITKGGEAYFEYIEKAMAEGNLLIANTDNLSLIKNPLKRGYFAVVDEFGNQVDNVPYTTIAKMAADAKARELNEPSWTERVFGSDDEKPKQGQGLKERKKKREENRDTKFLPKKEPNMGFWEWLTGGEETDNQTIIRK